MVTVLVVPLGLWVNVKSMKKLGKILMRLQSRMNDDGFVSIKDLKREFKLHDHGGDDRLGFFKDNNCCFVIYPNSEDELLGYDIDAYSGSWVFDYVKMGP